MAKRWVVGGIWAILMSAGVLTCSRWAIAEHPREMSNKVQKVTFLGARHVKEEELRNLTGVRAGMILNPKLNCQGCQKILSKYEEMGRPFADCQLIKGGDLGDTEVIYQITEGPKIKVRNIQFTGNTFVSSADLATKIKTWKEWFQLIGGSYNKQMVESNKQELEKYYRSHGYQDVRVTLETKRSADGHEVTFIYHIQEGPRYRIQGVPDVIGTQITPREQLIALSSFKSEDYLDHEHIVNSDSHSGVPIRAEAVPVCSPNRPGVCDVHSLSVECRIGKIRVTGNKHISSESILAHVPLAPGNILSYPDLQQAEKNLAEIGLFVVDAARGVRPTITVVDAEGHSDRKDLLITVKEKPNTKIKSDK